MGILVIPLRVLSCFPNFIQVNILGWWLGSAVAMYSAWIEFLESLLPSFIGLKWIKHKKYIETQIGYLKKEIEFEQINEILRGWFENAWINRKQKGIRMVENNKDRLNITGSEIILYQTDDG